MDNSENKPKKLGLKFNNKVDTKDLAKDYLSLKSSGNLNEPAKSSNLQSDANFVIEDQDLGLTTHELNKRMDVVKKAAKDKEDRDKEANDREEKSRQDITAQKDLQVKLEGHKFFESTTPEIKDYKSAVEGAILPEFLDKKEHKIINLSENNVKKQILSPAAGVIADSLPIKATKEAARNISNTKTDHSDKTTKLTQKQKQTYVNKHKKSGIINSLDQEDSDDFAFNKRGRYLKNKSNKRHSLEKVAKIVKEIEVYGDISVVDLAAKMSERSVDVIKELMKLGVMAKGDKILDVETAELIVNSFGHKFKKIDEITVSSLLAIDSAVDKDDPTQLRTRPAVVTVMGHVDHGKTSLLDAIRSTDVASKEFGGITQNVGAYQVKLADEHKITFIDTPGHEAFTAMRSRGAQVTDIAILVVAADDGINKQTVEAISHAKAANLPIIVAVNKIDKFDDYAGPLSRIKNEMLAHNLVSEDMGGDVIFIPVSALKKINLDKLEEAIILLAEVMQLKARYEGLASGVVLDSRLDKHQGAYSSLLVTRGTLKVGDFIVTGGTYGKIRSIYNDKGKILQYAEPSDPISIVGLEKVASAGDKFLAVQDEKKAREMAGSYSDILREKNLALSSPVKNLLDPFAPNLQKDLPLIIKADSCGSLDAIVGSLAKIISQEVMIKILHRAVGGINESDISLANASGARILAFNVRMSNQANSSARDKIDVRYYSIIYDLLDDVKALVLGMLKPVIREEYLGNVEIRQVFNVTKVGKVAGCYVTKGLARRGASMRLLRNDVVIHEGKLKTLKRFKDDVKEVKENFECGIVFEDYENIAIGDQVEIFTYTENKRVEI
jgi:translation initiation factor IF-2